MRTTFTIVLIVLALPVAWSQEIEKKVSTHVSEVAVFLKGAQVTRQTSIEVPAQTTTWVMTGLSPSVNEQSIQVEADDDVKLLSVSFRVNHMDQIKKSEQIITLEKEKKQLVQLIHAEKNNEEVLNEEEVMLKSNREIGGQQQGVNIADLKVAVDYFRARMTEIKQKQRETQQQRAAYGEELQRIESQLAELRNVKVQPTGEVVIKTSARRAIKTPLRVTYLVQEARWYPSYDIRAKDIKSPIQITYKANVSQQSGEDWENVKLTISSANPSVTSARPILNAWYLGFNNGVANRSGYSYGMTANANEVRGRVTSAEDGEPLPGVNIVIKGTTVGTVTDANGEYSVPLTSDAQTLIFSFIGLQTQEVPLNSRSIIDASLAMDVTQLSEVVVTALGVSGNDDSYGSGSYQARVRKTIIATPVVRQTDVEFTLDEQYSMRSDGEVRTVDMIEYEMDAFYQYYCVPKLDLDAFLMARLTGWDEYNLLEGEASLFFEGRYVGKTILDTRQTSDTLSLSLGRDKNVLVTREKVKDFSSSQVLSGNRKVLFGYEIVVRNKKQQEIDIRIEDQLPVPNTREIEVDKIEDSKAEYAKDSGLLTWNKKIAAGNTEKMVLKYAVKYPKYSRVVLE
jgi:hypothetical protein